MQEVPYEGKECKKFNAEGNSNAKDEEKFSTEKRMRGGIKDKYYRCSGRKG